MSNTNTSEPRPIRFDLVAKARDEAGQGQRFLLRAAPTWAMSALGGGHSLSQLESMPEEGFRLARGRGDRKSPCFAIEVPDPGYAIWLFDAVSDDFSQALTLRVALGPETGHARRTARAAISLAGPEGRSTWRSAGTADKDRHDLRIGGASVSWANRHLTIQLDHMPSSRLGRALSGRIQIDPTALTESELPITADGAHVWRPFAPTARVHVDLGTKLGHWIGHGGFDGYFGTRNLGMEFTSWSRSRFPMVDGALLFVEAHRGDRPAVTAGYHFTDDGIATAIALPERLPLASTIWALERSVRGDEGTVPQEILTVINLPDQSSALVETILSAQKLTGLHETVDLRRRRWLHQIASLGLAHPGR